MILELVVLFALIWLLGTLVISKLESKFRLEAYVAGGDGTTAASAGGSQPTMSKDPDAFPDCTNCVRYFDTVICKCKGSDELKTSAFLYPTNITPDVNLNQIGGSRAETASLVPPM